MIKSQNAVLKTRRDFQHRYSRDIGDDDKPKVSSETVHVLTDVISELSQIAQMVVGIDRIIEGVSPSAHCFPSSSWADQTSRGQ